jgi:tetratricopeptide (TPR) repeat protein
MNKKKLCALFIGVLCAARFFAQTVLWDEYIILRDALYNSAYLSSPLKPLYDKAVDAAKKKFTGGELLVALSKCEYMLGRAFQEEEKKNDAIRCYEQGIAFAERAIAVKPDAEAYETLAGCIGQMCMLKPTSWVMANGLKVEQYAKKALDLNSRAAAARYFIASRWVFGPGIFGNPQKGVKEMEAMLNGQADLQKDDFFNAYSAIGYAYERLKKYEEARLWVSKSLELYPANRFARDLFSQIEQSRR